MRARNAVAGILMLKSIYKRQVPIYRAEIGSHTVDEHYGDDENKFYPYAHHSPIYIYRHSQQTGIIITGYWKAAQFRRDY
jgi:hypothetical protein